MPVHIDVVAEVDVDAQGDLDLDDQAGLDLDVDRRFAELVYADDDLVRGEFEAIVAAEWGPTPPGRLPGAEPEPGSPGSDSEAAVPVEPRSSAGTQPHAVSRSGRERAPPPGF